MEVDARLQADGATEIGAGGQQHLAAAGLDGRLDGGVDSGGVEGAAVAFGAEVADIEDGGGGGARR